MSRVVDVKFQGLRVFLRDDSEQVIRGVDVLHDFVKLAPSITDVGALRVAIDFIIDSNKLVIRSSGDLRGSQVLIHQG